MTYKDGDSKRLEYNEKITTLLKNSSIELLEIWDYNLTSAVVSMLLTENRKARYYFNLGYLAVYHYTDQNLTYIDHFSSYRLDSSCNKLVSFAPITEQVNDIVHSVETQFFYRYIGALPEDKEKHKVKTLFIHTLPPYTEDDSDQIINQDGILHYSASNPIRFCDYINSLIQYKDTLYIARTKTYHLVYPQTIASVTDKQTRHAHYVKTVIYPYDQIDYKKPGLAYAERRARKVSKKHIHDIDVIHKRLFSKAFEEDEKPGKKVHQENMHDKE